VGDLTGVPPPGEYVPTPIDWVREQVEQYEASQGREANLTPRTGIPIIVLTTLGNKTGFVRKTALIRIEHGGVYGLVASFGGAPEHPVWYRNLLAAPDDAMIQDGPLRFAVNVRQVDGVERDRWWERSLVAYPKYAEYESLTTRRIPVLVAAPR
jgi:F420H(2)-dependent quinone reductase